MTEKEIYKVIDELRVIATNHCLNNDEELSTIHAVINIIKEVEPLLSAYTNGEVIQAMFPDCQFIKGYEETHMIIGRYESVPFSKEFWNALYKKGENNNAGSD